MVGNSNLRQGMKMKIGNKLMWEREDRKLNQTEMANLLGMSQSAYSRLERNEVSVELEEVVNYAKKLDVPVQEFLPETFSIHNDHNDNGQVGFLIGNFYNYGDKELAQENQFLKDKIKDLEEKNILLQDNHILLKEKIKNLEKEMEAMKKL